MRLARDCVPRRSSEPGGQPAAAADGQRKRESAPVERDIQGHRAPATFPRSRTAGKRPVASAKPHLRQQQSHARPPPRLPA